MYYPYGGERWSSGADSNHYKFAGKERDSETGLDYFGARYFGSGVGRWMSPDWADRPTEVPYADFGDPRSLNLYGYVRNNPVTTPDLDGHEGDPGDPGCGCLTQEQYAHMGHDMEDFGSKLIDVIKADAAAVWSVLLTIASSSGPEAVPGLDPGPGIAANQLKEANAASQQTPGNGQSTTEKNGSGGTVPPEDRDPKRRFTPKESNELKEDAGGRCTTCGQETTKSTPYTKGSKHASTEGEAGHKKAWSKGGRTAKENGKHQCRGCNLKERENSK